MTASSPPASLRLRWLRGALVWLAPLRRPALSAQRQRNTERIGLAAIFLVALGVRVFYNLTVARNYVPIHDAADYNAMAIHLLNEHCLCIAPHVPTTVRPPGFPLFLAGVYALTGADPLHARLALSIVGAGTCMLAALIAREMAGWRVGLLAGLVAATYPQLFIWDAWLYSESLAVFFFAACCLVSMRLVRQQFTSQPRAEAPSDHSSVWLGIARNMRRDGWRWLAAGALFGATALVRPNGFYALLALLVALGLFAVARRALWQSLRAQPQAAVATLYGVWRNQTVRGMAWRSGLLLLGCSLALAPWVARNAAVTGGAFVPFTTVDGIVIAGSYNDLSYRDPYYAGEWVNPRLVAADAPTVARFPAVCGARCEVSRSRALGQLGEHWAQTHIAELPLLVYRRMKAFWRFASPVDEEGMPIWRPFAELYPTFVIALALVGLGMATLRRWRRALVPALFIGVVTLGAAAFYGAPRMRAPMEPMLVSFAAVALVWLFDLAYDTLAQRLALSSILSATTHPLR